MGFLGVKKQKRASGPSTELLHKLECRACPLDKIKENRHPHMAPTGAEKPLIYILGEAPGKDEDRNNEQFIGVSGEMLRARLPKQYRDQIRWNNVVRTRPLKNATPQRIEIECCRPSIERDIVATKPAVIWGFGGVPLTWAANVTGIMNWRGRRIPVNIGGHECWYYPMLHPAFLLRIRRDWMRGKGPKAIGSELERAFVFDIKNAVRDLKDLPPAVVHNRSVAEYGVEIYYGQPGDFGKLHKSMQWAMKQPVAGVDYETNRHRPYDEGAKILTAAIGTDEISFAFSLEHPQQLWTPKQVAHIKDWWKDFLKSRCMKVVHQLPFEQEWTAVKFGKEYLRAGPWGCTITQASTLDERSGQDEEGNRRKNKDGGPLSLNFLCKQHFGLLLKSLSKLDRKNLETTNIEEVLRYNAMDSKYHYLLFMAQQERLAAIEGQQELYERGVRRVPTCVLTQVKGINDDLQETGRLEKKYNKGIKESLERIAALEEVQTFRKKFKFDFNPDNPHDVVKLLRDIMKRREGMQEDGKYSTDKNVLAKIDHPVSGLILKLRGDSKKLSTYTYREHVWPDGKLHCILNHGPFTSTFRLSCEDPNLQNIPKRAEQNREIRKQFVAALKRSLVAIDYGQIEARVIAMASKDKRFVKALWERYDVHTEWARRLAHAYPRRIGGKRFLDDPVVMEDFRTDIKNQWTFPLFFGASLESAAGYLRIPADEIRSEYRQFQKQFSGVFDWQEVVWSNYEQNGYVENLFGRRRRAPLSKNEAINAPIQSTACEIMMDGMNRLSELADAKGDDYYQPLISVHDELLFELPDTKVDLYLEKIIPTMLKADYDFVNVPLTVEVSLGNNLMPFDKKKPKLNPSGIRKMFTASSDDWKRAA